MVDTRPGWIEFFLNVASAISTRADCTRRQVGAVLVDSNHRIISTGYNGAPSKHPGCLDGHCPRGQKSVDEVAPLSDYSEVGGAGFCIAVHAEANAILYASRDTKGASLYITCEPCADCRRLIAGAGIVSVDWPTGYLVGSEIMDFDIDTSIGRISAGQRVLVEGLQVIR